MLCVLGTEGGRFAQLWEDPSARAYSPLIPHTPMKGWPCLLTALVSFAGTEQELHTIVWGLQPQSCQQG